MFGLYNLSNLYALLIHIQKFLSLLASCDISFFYLLKIFSIYKLFPILFINL